MLRSWGLEKQFTQFKYWPCLLLLMEPQALTKFMSSFPRL